MYLVVSTRPDGSQISIGAPVFRIPCRNLSVFHKNIKKIINKNKNKKQQKKVRSPHATLTLLIILGGPARVPQRPSARRNTCLRATGLELGPLAGANFCLQLRWFYQLGQRARVRCEGGKARSYLREGCVVLLPCVARAPAELEASCACFQGDGPRYQCDTTVWRPMEPVLNAF